MSSLEPFLRRVRPAMEAFLRAPSKSCLNKLEDELRQFNWTDMNVFHVQILLPLVLKLEELGEQNLELRTGTLNCIRTVTANLYLKDVKGLRTMLIITLRQIRDCSSAVSKPNLSEEIKLAAVLCMTETLRRSTTDVLELFYTDESTTLLGQVLLALVEFVEREKYRTLVIAAMECLMTAFYVHDEADCMDIVLRGQVANTLFIFLPKVVTVLFKTSLAEEKLGATLKSTAIKALGRILCVIYEEMDEPVIRSSFNASQFKDLIRTATQCDDNSGTETDIFDKSKKSKKELGERLELVQCAGRSPQWFEATSKKLRIVFTESSILRSHCSVHIRQQYAQMCCALIERCAHRLKDNFIYLLESVVAMAEDEDESIRAECRRTLQRLQGNEAAENIFDGCCDELFDKHLIKLPRIIIRSDEAEQYAEYMFLKGFLQHVNPTKLQVLLSVPKNMEMFCKCLIAMVDMQVSHELLVEEHSLRQVDEANYAECSKLRWRQYKNLSSLRCIHAVQAICRILGKTVEINRMIGEYMLALLAQSNASMNELLLLMLWIATLKENNEQERGSGTELIELLLKELCDEKHWHLALQPDPVRRLRIDKPSNWFTDSTPGLYESAIEIRTQDCDSDDEAVSNERAKRVSIVDAEFNILHTCLALDALGHCAIFLDHQFDAYLFRCLHRVLLKIASSNTMLYQAAYFALISMQKALHFAKTSQLIQTHTDYITYHLNTILRRTPESRSAVDILTVLLQFSDCDAIPHLDSIFQTIRIECSKTHQADNVKSYLKVYNAFLMQITHWQMISDHGSTSNAKPMQVDEIIHNDPFVVWMDALEKPCEENADMEHSANQPNNDEKNEDEKEPVFLDDVKPVLARHIEMTKNINKQVLKFMTCSDRVHQILALECLIAGVPLLKDNEDELLPLVHQIWQPLVEKFRQKDPIILNRCFSLLNVLATYAKDFILKRTIDDVIPFLQQFLKETCQNSATELIIAQTQEYKLQLKLLQNFANLICCMKIDGRKLNDIAEVIALYLSERQPKELQEHSINFFQVLKNYNGPLAYLIVLNQAHLKDCKLNAAKVWDLCVEFHFV